MKRLPQIRIKNAWLLQDNASVHLHKLWAKEGEKLETFEEMDAIVARYKAAWEPYEAKVLEAMTETLGLTFRQEIIDVYIAPWFWAFSDPMVIGTAYDDERFVTTLTHELLHRLLTDNRETDYGTLYREKWVELFGAQNHFVTLVHIPVHAMLESIFAESLQEPERTIADREKCSDDYKQAWEYVDKHGYEEIIEELKEQYKTIHREQKQRAAKG